MFQMFADSFDVTQNAEVLYREPGVIFSLQHTTIELFFCTNALGIK
jgi:hypothetical protein